MLVDRVPKPKTARMCWLTAALVSIVWLTLFALALFYVASNWNG